MFSGLRQLLAVILSSWLLYVVYSWYCLVRNYFIARKIAIPLRIIPINPENPLWMVVDKKFFIPIFEKLPFGTGSFTRFNWRGWEFCDKYRAHEEMGDIFMMVTPGRNWIHLCNPEALAEVLKKEKDFPRPMEIFEMTKVFGDNISTVEGKTWHKHRKITSTALNERNNELVWTETICQSSDMGKYWGSKGAITTTANDTRTLSLNVLSAAGFGKLYSFQGHEDKASDSIVAIPNYKDALQTILENCLLLFVFGTNVIKNPWLPAKAQRLNEAVVNFKAYMTEVYEAEKEAMANDKPAENNLMTQLIRASLGEDGLTETEVYGNIFIFNFAGHDTTAHTLTFAIYLLATAPDVQQWITEELEHVFGKRSFEAWNYSSDFPRLKRTLAILYETLRLYPPVSIAKSTGKHGQVLNVEGKTLVLPANTLLIPNHIAAHTHPKFWGSDSMTWKSSRRVTSRREKAHF